MNRRLRTLLLRWLREGQRRVTLAGAPVPPRNPTLTLTRIIGNDLWPRHAQGQSLVNLDFILKHEPAFPDCRKVFVLNRIVDPDTAARAQDMIARAGHEVITLPFDPVAYTAQRMETGFFDGDEYFQSPAFSRLSDFRKSIRRLWAAAPKVCQVMNINGARNAALSDGQAQSDWTLVLDGSCFLSAEAFATLRGDLTRTPLCAYVVFPMHRLARNEDVFITRPDPNEPEEPQIIFHRSARGRFDERFPYGMRDKTSLLQQIGVPGAWDLWENMPWLPASVPLADRHRWKRASTAVFRLTSGVDAGRLEQSGAHKSRYSSRTVAIFRTLAALDARFGAPDEDRTRMILGLGETDV